MAEIQKQKIACPKCKKEIEVDVWGKIELPYDAEQREKVLENTFYRVNCDTCKITFAIAYRCQYNDMERKHLIWVVPRAEYEAGKADKDIQAYNERIQNDNTLRLAQGGYRYRIVHNDNELREKVMIFEEGLDDRYIETMKLVYVPLIKKKLNEQSKINGIFFEKKPDGGFHFIAIVNNLPPLRADINWDIYEDMKVKLKDVVEAKTPEGLCVINAKWALDVMMTPVEGADNATNN